MIISMYHLVNSDLWKQKQNKRMNNKASITALMSSFGRAFHAEYEDHPVFADHLAKELMTAEEYAAVQGYISSAEHNSLNQRLTLRSRSRKNYCAGL